MNVKAMANSMGMDNQDLVTIFYDEAKRIAPDEKEAISLTREAVRQFLHHSKNLTS